MASVCVLGLGKMGTAMSRRLHAQGHRVVVWNRTFAKAEKLCQEDSSSSPFIAKRSIEEAIKELSPDALIMAVMSDTPTLLDLLESDSGLKKGLSGRVLANMASASPDEGREIAKLVIKLGAAGYLDCAYCGPPTKVMAGAGQVFVSSDTMGLVDKHAKVLGQLGSVTDCGKVGASRALDYGVVDLAFVNFLSFAANSEMMKREGVDPKIFFEQAAKRLATVPSMFESAYPRMASRNPEDYKANPTATLGTWRNFWASRLPYLKANDMATRVPDMMVGLIDEAAGSNQEHIDADVTRLQEVVRYENDTKQDQKRARTE